MGTLTDYFAANRYHGKYQIGDRVFGYYEKMPFVGSVGNDTVISEERGAQISVHLDLPLQTKNGVRSIIIVEHKDIRPLKDYDDDTRVPRTTAKNRK